MKRVDAESSIAFFWGSACAVLNTVVFVMMRSLTSGDLRAHAGSGILLLPLWIGCCGAIAIVTTKVRRWVDGPPRLLLGVTLFGISYSLATTPMAWYFCILPTFVGVGLIIATFFRGAGPGAVRLAAIGAGYIYFASYPWNIKLYEMGNLLLPYRFSLALPLSVLVLSAVPPATSAGSQSGSAQSGRR